MGGFPQGKDISAMKYVLCKEEKRERGKMGKDKYCFI
jgi:hypothetical protein